MGVLLWGWGGGGCGGGERKSSRGGVVSMGIEEHGVSENEDWDPRLGWALKQDGMGRQWGKGCKKKLTGAGQKEWGSNQK